MLRVLIPSRAAQNAMRPSPDPMSTSPVQPNPLAAVARTYAEASHVG